VLNSPCHRRHLPSRDPIRVRSVWTAQRGASTEPKGGHRETRRIDDHHVGDGVGVLGHMWLCVEQPGALVADGDVGRIWPAGRLFAVGASAQDERVTQPVDATSRLHHLGYEYNVGNLFSLC
jgi:hypothetical protein